MTHCNYSWLSRCPEMVFKHDINTEESLMYCYTFLIRHSLAGLQYRDSSSATLAAEEGYSPSLSLALSLYLSTVSIFFVSVHHFPLSLSIELSIYLSIYFPICLSIYSIWSLIWLISHSLSQSQNPTGLSDSFSGLCPVAFSNAPVSIYSDKLNIFLMWIYALNIAQRCEGGIFHCPFLPLRL